MFTRSTGLTLGLLAVGAALLVACGQSSPNAAGPSPLALGALAARPSETCDNVEAEVSAVFTSGSTAAGTINGDLNGSVTAAIHDIRAAGNGALHVQMEHHYTTADGQIDTRDQAVLAPVDAAAGLYRMNNRLTIEGGTGIYAEASGYLHTHGEVDFVAGTIELDLKGRVCR